MTTIKNLLFCILFVTNILYSSFLQNTQISINTTNITEKNIDIILEKLNDAISLIKQRKIENTFEKKNEIVYAISNVNIRTLPDPNSSKYAVLKKDSSILRTGINKDGWSQVYYDNKALYINSSYLSLSKPKPYTSPYLNKTIIKDGTVDDIYLEIVCKEYEKLPQNIKDYFTEKQLLIYVTDKNLDKYFFEGQYGSVQGCADWEKIEIYIEDREKACKNSTLHECGHILDFCLNWSSSTKEFQNIYLKEKDNAKKIMTNHCVSSELEYFAESFLFFINKQNELKKYCPDTYQYINNIVNEV